MNRYLPKGEPILIDCEGSGCPGHLDDGETGMCSMCGYRCVIFDGVIASHQRDDIIARVKRGDFG